MVIESFCRFNHFESMSYQLNHFDLQFELQLSCVTDSITTHIVTNGDSTGSITVSRHLQAIYENRFNQSWIVYKSEFLSSKEEWLLQSPLTHPKLCEDHGRPDMFFD